jgi:hypothetical protein
LDYYDLYHALKARVGYEAPEILFDDRLRVHNHTFRSACDDILPGETRYVCPAHGCELHDVMEPEDGGDEGLGIEVPGLHASRLAENRAFRYHVFLPSATRRAREAILLFNGFNEKHWHKYLPWAYRLACDTGKAVILFPIAFHMNRAPMAWSDRRLMHRASERRRQRFPAIVNSTLSNAAISIRLQARPQRFIWSGLQTYYDVLQLLAEIAADRHPDVAAGARIDLFAYSIGCLLAQILLMTDPGGALADSRLCMFCGGTVFNRMSPVSRFILDSECNVALYSYVVEHLESHLRDNERLRHFLGEQHPEGINFRAMLNAVAFRRQREAHFQRLGRRLFAIALDSDTVIPPGEVMNTLQGPMRDLPARVDVLSFDYDCRHEDPFPATTSLRGPADAAFCRVFDLATAFYACG